MNDIRNKDDVKVFVDEFYSRVKTNVILRKIFAKRIAAHEWQNHLDRMYGFWNTVLFGKMDYKGNPFSKHIGLDIIDLHFDEWISILSEVIDENFNGTKANEVKWRAQKMSDMFKKKLLAKKEHSSNKSII